MKSLFEFKCEPKVDMTSHISKLENIAFRLRVSIYTCIPTSIYPSFLPSNLPSLHPSIHSSIDLSFFLSILPSIHPSSLLSFHPSMLKSTTIRNEKFKRNTIRNAVSFLVENGSGSIKRMGYQFRYHMPHDKR